MLIKIIIVLLLLFILFNLFRALVIMVTNKQSQQPMSHYLGRRVALSAVVLVLIIIALKLGLIKSNPAPSSYTTAHTQTQISITKPHQQNANTKPQLERQNAYLG